MSPAVYLLGLIAAGLVVLGIAIRIDRRRDDKRRAVEREAYGADDQWGDELLGIRNSVAEDRAERREEIDVLVHGSGPFTDEDRAALAELVAATRRHFAKDQPSTSDGARIQDARVAAGLTLRDLAKQVDCPPSQLSRIEQGVETPGDELLTRLAAVLTIEIGLR